MLRVANASTGNWTQSREADWRSSSNGIRPCLIRLEFGSDSCGSLLKNLIMQRVADSLTAVENLYSERDSKAAKIALFMKVAVSFLWAFMTSAICEHVAKSLPVRRHLRFLGMRFSIESGDKMLSIKVIKLNF